MGWGSDDVVTCRDVKIFAENGIEFAREFNSRANSSPKRCCLLLVVCCLLFAADCAVAAIAAVAAVAVIVVVVAAAAVAFLFSTAFPLSMAAGVPGYSLDILF